MVTAAGPKVADGFGSGAGVERPARPECKVAMRAVAAPEPVAARGMLGDGSSGPQVGSAVGMLGNGGFWPQAGWPDQQVIIVRPGAAEVNLY